MKHSLPHPITAVCFFLTKNITIIINIILDNVRWTELFGTFLNYALIDKIEKPLQVQVANGGSILSFTLPHFWVQAVIDPGIIIAFIIIIRLLCFAGS